jgi:molybdopterin converting factor small subunit
VATVHIPSDMTACTGGIEEVAIDAGRVDELMHALASRFPAIAPRLETMAVAIDGDIYNDAEFIEISSTSEIFLVPRMAGG